MPLGNEFRYVPLNTEESSNEPAEVVPLTSAECSAQCEVVSESSEERIEQPATVNLPPPPCYEEQAQAANAPAATNQGEEDEVYTPPPHYNVASKLPSYEEAERTKDEEASGNPDGADCHGGSSTRLADAFPYRYTTLIPGWEDYQELDLTGNNSIKLGNDVIFFTTFLISFLFNWIGFLISHCLSQSIAGRFGALAGFGLSMVKWTVIMKHTLQIEAVQTEWLWWIILLLGLLMFFRGTVQYIRIKHQWSNLTTEARTRYARFF